MKIMLLPLITEIEELTQLFFAEGNVFIQNEISFELT